MSSPSLVQRLDLERLDRDLFRGDSPDEPRPTVFGGQVAAQALVAAVRTVERASSESEALHTAHSLHAYFLRPGDPKRPIIYEVDRIRDGRSFTTRRVVAIQNGEAIFNMSVSFQDVEDGYAHQIDMPEVPEPETVPTNEERVEAEMEKRRHPYFDWVKRLERPIELRDVEPLDPTQPQPMAGPHHVWFRAKEDLPEDPLFHQCVLTYASDIYLADGGLRVHGLTWFDRTMKVASLDHAVWFHRPFRADDWLLYVIDSPSTNGARGFSRGSVFNRKGDLIASTAQEALMRRRPTA